MVKVVQRKRARGLRIHDLVRYLPVHIRRYGKRCFCIIKIYKTIKRDIAPSYNGLRKKYLRNRVRKVLLHVTNDTDSDGDVLQSKMPVITVPTSSWGKPFQPISSSSKSGAYQKFFSCRPLPIVSWPAGLVKSAQIQTNLRRPRSHYTTHVIKLLCRLAQKCLHQNRT